MTKADGEDWIIKFPSSDDSRDSLITKASLGTSPISSIPYVLSLNFAFTLGNFTIFFSVLLILLQILILRKNFKLENVLQIPVSEKVPL